MATTQLDAALAAAIAAATTTTTPAAPAQRQRYDFFGRKVTVASDDTKKYTNLFVTFVDIPFDAPDPALHGAVVLPIEPLNVKRVFLSKLEARSYVPEERLQAIASKLAFLDLLSVKLEGCEVQLGRINLGSLDDLQKKILSALDAFAFNPHFEVREAAPRLQNTWANGLAGTAQSAVPNAGTDQNAEVFGK